MSLKLSRNHLPNERIGCNKALSVERGMTADANLAQYTDDEVEFLKAMDQYKREKQRPNPAWHEVLSVLIGLGYRKVSADGGPRASPTAQGD